MMCIKICDNWMRRTGKLKKTSDGGPKGVIPVSIDRGHGINYKSLVTYIGTI